MKHLRFILCCVLGMCWALTGCGKPERKSEIPLPEATAAVPATAVSLSDLKLEVGKGAFRQLTAEGGDGVTWRSSDESVATVDESGRVVGVNLGSCTVTAENGQGQSASCAVEVKKACYITVDDGPNMWTEGLLDVMSEYDVHATFFVWYTSELEEGLKKIKAQGSVIGMHTYSHKYNVCYRNMTSYYYGLERLSRQIEDIVGERPTLIRFPGGTHNSKGDPLLMVRIVNGASDMGYRIFDWTATTGDTSAVNASTQFSIDNVKRDCTEDVEILLMHNRGFNAKALQTIIPYLRENGYVFETLDRCVDENYIFKPRYLRTHSLRPSTGITVGETEVSVRMGGSLTLHAQMVPGDSTDYIRWECDNPSVADVWPDGSVIPLAQGTVVVRAITSAGHTASCVVTVLPEGELSEP